ncbi:hypothetical protein BFG57_09535 [Bacillus solimangrovi]|uniref:Nucleotidyltransferase n=2 Tax=Bacillus solimangrovi TaxID=1305675 RepID=A0A1E5LJ97_9BACI|nr:hypothetical protein BFG57_09535 [Bacillus solimangrovi]
MISNRKTVFTALVGSYNYNLSTTDSDKDYKAFFLPTFDDLYYGDKQSLSKTSLEKDIEYHDIRKLPIMLWKSNVNFVETLFSVEYLDSDNKFFNYLFEKREDIARMNLPYLYEACQGMFYQKKKEYERDIIKDTKKTYKHAMSALRIIDFLHRYKQNDFSSFKSAIWYPNNDSYKDFLLSVRSGNVCGIESLLINKEKSLESIKDYYKLIEPNKELKMEIDATLKQHIFLQIF